MFREGGSLGWKVYERGILQQFSTVLLIILQSHSSLLLYKMVFLSHVSQSFKSLMHSHQYLIQGITAFYAQYSTEF